MSTFVDATSADIALIEELLGRPLGGRCAVVVRRANGQPVVIENEPHLRDGTPMPTLYWLIDPDLNEQVSRLESEGGVHRFEATIDPDDIQRAHDDYRRRREAATVRRDGPQPSGGVGGTRQGLKCLHAHLANYLAGNDDVVGGVVADAISLPALRVENVRG